MGFYKAYYFLYFAAAAAILPFLTLYYQSAGMTGQQIGLLAGIAPLLVMVGGPLWGGLADATRQVRAVLFGSIGAAIAFALLISLSNDFGSLLLAVSAYAFCVAPILPMVDGSALEALGERQHEYGRLRLWGSISWGISAPLLGALIDRAGLPWAFYSYALITAGSLFIIWQMPVTQVGLSQPIWTGFRLLSTDRRWLSLSLLSLLAGLSIAVTNNYLFLYLDEIGASKALMGLSLTVATLSELPVFFFSDRLLFRFGSPGLIFISLLASGGRALAYSVIQTPWLVLPIQLLHGLAFAALWIGGVSLARKLSPDGMVATAQGLFSSLVFGLGAAFGGLAGGALYQSLGAAGMFRWTGLGVLAGLLLFRFVGELTGDEENKSSGALPR
jgi:PPP family 3-phenylpropionic acid transporter